MHRRDRQRCANALRELLENVHRAVIEDGVHGIEPQAIEVVFAEPVERIVQ